MKNKIAVAVFAVTLLTPALWADEMNAGGTAAPATTASDTQAPKMHKKHGGKHHKKMMKKTDTSSTPSAPATTPAAQ
jgi:hypothetical protein